MIWKRNSREKLVQTQNAVWPIRSFVRSFACLRVTGAQTAENYNYYSFHSFNEKCVQCKLAEHKAIQKSPLHQTNNMKMKNATPWAIVNGRRSPSTSFVCLISFCIFLHLLLLLLLKNKLFSIWLVLLSGHKSSQFFCHVCCKLLLRLYL